MYPARINKAQHHTADRNSTHVHRRNSQRGDNYHCFCLVFWGPAYVSEYHWRFHHYMRYANELTRNVDALDTICITGIILFTYHKYRRSIESPIPLDGHGNPITTGDGLLEGVDEQRGEFLELEETLHLTANSRASYSFEEVLWTRAGNRTEADSVTSHRIERPNLTPRRRSRVPLVTMMMMTQTVPSSTIQHPSKRGGKP